MRRTTWTLAAMGTLLGVFLSTAPTALSQSAVDQYQEGIPSAGGQKPSQDAIDGQGGAGQGTAKIDPATRGKLDRTKNGPETARTAQITAPGRSDSESSNSSGGEGLGLLLPLILAATLTSALGIVLARRRQSQPSG